MGMNETDFQERLAAAEAAEMQIEQWRGVEAIAATKAGLEREARRQVQKARARAELEAAKQKAALEIPEAKEKIAEHRELLHRWLSDAKLLASQGPTITALLPKIARPLFDAVVTAASYERMAPTSAEAQAQLEQGYGAMMDLGGDFDRLWSEIGGADPALYLGDEVIPDRLASILREAGIVYFNRNWLMRILRG